MGVNLGVNTRWVDRYMAVSFLKGGRTFDGCDCWGLYELIVAQEIGNAPSFAGVTMNNPRAVQRAIAGAIAAGQFRKIDGDPVQVSQAFDAVLMLAYVGDTRADLHIGCATGDGRVIHIEAGIGPRCIRLDDSFVKPRIRNARHGVYRPSFLESAAA